MIVIENNKKKSYIIIGLIIGLVILVFIGKQIADNKFNINNSNSISIADAYKVYNFGSTTCPACTDMKPIYEKIKEDYSRSINFEYIDANKNYKLSNNYRVEYTPTFIIVDSNGTEVDRLVGVVSETKFREFVNKWLINK